MLATLQKYPKISVLFLVMTLMAGTNFLTFKLQGDIIKIHESSIETLTSRIEESKLVLDAQILESRTLASQLSESYEETILPDGTVTKKHVKDVMKEEQSYREEKIKLSYEMKIKELEHKLAIENTKETITSRALSVSYGYSTSLESYAHVQYDLWGNIGISGMSNGSSFGIGLGVRF